MEDSYLGSYEDIDKGISKLIKDNPEIDVMGEEADLGDD